MELQQVLFLCDLLREIELLESELFGELLLSLWSFAHLVGLFSGILLGSGCFVVVRRRSDAAPGVELDRGTLFDHA